MRKKIYLLLAGFFGVFLSTKLFPTVTSFHFSKIISAFIFSPFGLLGSVLCFIGGFLSFSALIKGLIEKGYKVKKQKAAFTKQEVFVMMGMIMSYILLFFANVWVTLASLILAMYYSIMDIRDKYHAQSRMRE